MLPFEHSLKSHVYDFFGSFSFPSSFLCFSDEHTLSAQTKDDHVLAFLRHSVRARAHFRIPLTIIRVNHFSLIFSYGRSNFTTLLSRVSQSLV